MKFLPVDFPPWGTVRHHFDQFKILGIGSLKLQIRRAGKKKVAKKSLLLGLSIARASRLFMLLIKVIEAPPLTILRIYEKSASFQKLNEAKKFRQKDGLLKERFHGLAMIGVYQKIMESFDL